MAQPFKKKTTRYYTPEGRRCPPSAPGAVRRDEESRKWYGLVPGADGRRKAVPLCPDLAKSRQLLAKLITTAALRDGGLADPYEAHKRRLLAEHLADWEADLLARGRTAKHASLSLSRARRVVQAAGLRSTTDITASGVQAALADLRKEGASVATVNHHLTAVKGFIRWLVRDRRMGESPLAHLRAGNAQVDKRHERRELTGDEVAWLLDATRGAPPRCHLAGPDRAMLYEVALRTGLRAAELASLTAASFDLASSPPTVTVQAAYSKHRREDVLPLHGGLAARLRDWLNGRASQAPLWPGKWAELFKAGKMLKADLALARSAWVESATTPDEKAARGRDADFLATRDGAGKVADFHALRHTFISGLARAGVAPKVAQALARHSTITLTMDRYTHVGLHDLSGGINSLPPLPNKTKSGRGEALAMTGTDGAARSGCTQVAQTPGRTLRLLAPEGNGEGAEMCGTEGTQVPIVLALGSSCHLQATGVTEEAPPGFEPGVADLQSDRDATQGAINQALLASAILSLYAGLHSFRPTRTCLASSRPGQPCQPLSAPR